MKDAVIYARYSSDKQDEASIEAQVRACREYAASKGYAVLEVYADEAVSGKGSKTASRKAYQKLLRDVNKGRFDTILIHKYDRVARNLGEHVNLEKKLKDRAVELIAVAQDFGSSVEAKIMKTLMWSLSEYYLDNLSNETKKGHRETTMKAKHNGGYAPFGYDVVNQEYVVNELEAGYVRKIFDAAANREGFTAIIEELAAAGITGKRGKPIKYTQIYEMLRNEKYTGTYIYTPPGGAPGGPAEQAQRH
ncbi:recombinase family protein [Oscillospiraceae bacterium 44-5]